MRRTEYSFGERMAAGRAQADNRRGRGLPTGKSAKGWDAKRAPLDPMAWSSHVIIAQRDYQAAAREALNAFRVECLNGPSHDVYDIPF